MGERRAGSSASGASSEAAGRDELAHQIAQRCERALRGERQVVAIVGGSGIGKTRLVDDVVGLAPAAEVRRASGDPDEVNLAYGIVDQLGLLEHAAGTGRDLSDAAAVGDALVAALGDAEAPRRLLLLEDAQWMDRPSLLALTFALRRLGSQPLVAVVTTRDPAALPPGMWRLCEGPSGSVVRPAPLSLPEARDAVREWGVRPVSEPLLERLVRRTDGNPRHLRLLLEQSGPREHLDPRELPSAASAEVDDAVEARLLALSEAARSLVHAAAVYGSGASPALLGAVASVPAAGPPLEEAVAAGLLGRGPHSHDAVEIEHAARAAIYHRMTASRRAELHRRIADHLEDERLRLRHRLAGAEGYDPEVAERSADLAAREAARGRWHAAAEWELGVARCDPSADRRAAATRRAAHALVVAGEPAAAEELLGPERDPGESGDVTLVRARIAAARGDLRPATELLEAAWRTSRQDRAAVAAAAASHLAAIELADARGDQAARWARRALAADASEVGLTDVDPHSRLALSLLIAGRLDEARRVTVPSTDGGLDPRTDGTFGRAVVAAVSGSPRSARAELAELAHRARRSGPLPLWAFVQCWRSALAFRAGEWDDASTQATRATVAADHESWSFAAAAYACLSVPLAGRGEWEHAELALDEARTAARAAGEPRLVSASITAAIAWLAFVRDDHRAVLELTGELADAPFAHVPMLAGPPVTALRGLAAVRAGDAGTVDAAVKALDAHPAVPSAWWAGALAALRLGMDGASPAAAEALGAAARSVDDDHPVDRALLRLEGGGALRRAGRRAEAATELEAAAATFEELGAAPFLDRVDAERAMLGRRRRRRAAAPGGLTPSERAVADLAAQGWSNKEIAADLVLSVKTVEFHLSNVFRKLQVANRTQLANLRGDRAER